jgi:hypothetical protein
MKSFTCRAAYLLSHSPDGRRGRVFSGFAFFELLPSDLSCVNLQGLYQTMRIHAVMPGRVLRQLFDGFPELTFRSVEVAAGEMIQADGGLDQPLIEEPLLTTGVPPEFFPGIVGFEILAPVEFLNTTVKELIHPMKPKKKGWELQEGEMTQESRKKAGPAQDTRVAEPSCRR